MKKIYYNILLIGVMLLSGTSCSDYLDIAPSSQMPEEEVFRDPQKFKNFQTHLYSYLNGCNYGENQSESQWASWMYGGLGRFQTGSFDAMTDLGKATRDLASTNKWTLGDWGLGSGTKQEVELPYTEGYRAVRRCNLIIANIDKVENLTVEERDSYLGETIFLRGFFYFEMLKRYGGIPYIDRVLSIEEDLDLPRDSYETCVEKLCKDFDDAAALLPVKRTDADWGRATKGAALAYKARTLLYAASPLNNDNWESDKTKWVAAAKAAKAVMDLNAYQLNSMDEWENMYFGNTNKEVIFQRLEDSKKFEDGTRYGWTPPYYWNGAPGIGTKEARSTTTAPTQNFVDMFEMEDGSVPIRMGKEYNGLNPKINPESGYSDERMYENRDPRFYKTVVYNGMLRWFNLSQEPKPMQLWGNYLDGDRAYGENINTTGGDFNTGYLTRKMWPPQFYAGSQESVFMPWIFFRYTEIFMIYAEAMNEAFGPDVNSAADGLLMTAREALNVVRNRDYKINRDVKVVVGDKEGLRERIMNENAVEFFLEEHRFWDVVRWKKGGELFNADIYCAVVEADENGNTMKVNRRVLEKHVFRDYMHHYPIPISEIEKSDNLVQNPGWEVTE